VTEETEAGAAEPADIVDGLLPDGLMGYYDPDRHCIVLDARLTQAERRSTEAHERAHAERGHWNCSEEGPDGARMAARWERTADADAARRLIPLAALAAALLWTRDDPELAEHFQVDIATVVARRCNLTESERDYLAGYVDSAGRWSA
jgi:hypothetical protein